jgi:hypothetical protein
VLRDLARAQSRALRLLAVLLAWACAACDADAEPGAVGDAGGHDDAGDPDSAADAGSDAGAIAELDAGPTALVHAALWSAVSRADDPWASDAAVRCEPDSFGEETLGGELVFYVRTDVCPALTVRQGIRGEVPEGARITLRAFHFPLSAPEPGVARMIVKLGDDEVWRTELPIPSPAEELSAEWTAPTSYVRGTPLWFHVENHGSNEYALISVMLHTQ